MSRRVEHLLLTPELARQTKKEWYLRLQYLNFGVAVSAIAQGNYVLAAYGATIGVVFGLIKSFSCRQPRLRNAKRGVGVLLPAPRKVED